MALCDRGGLPKGAGGGRQGEGEGEGRLDVAQCQKLLNLRVVKLIYAQCNNLGHVNKIHYTKRVGSWRGLGAGEQAAS